MPPYHILRGIALTVCLLVAVRGTAGAAIATAIIKDTFAPRLAAESIYGYRAQFSAEAKNMMQHSSIRGQVRLLYKAISVAHPLVTIRGGKAISVIRVHLIANGRYYQDGLIITREHVVDLDPVTGMLLRENTNVASPSLARQYGFPAPSLVAY